MRNFQTCRERYTRLHDGRKQASARYSRGEIAILPLKIPIAKRKSLKLLFATSRTIGILPSLAHTVTIAFIIKLSIASGPAKGELSFCNVLQT